MKIDYLILLSSGIGYIFSSLIIAFYHTKKELDVAGIALKLKLIFRHGPIRSIFFLFLIESLRALWPSYLLYFIVDIIKVQVDLTFLKYFFLPTSLVVALSRVVKIEISPDTLTRLLRDLENELALEEGDKLTNTISSNEIKDILMANQDAFIGFISPDQRESFLADLKDIEGREHILLYLRQMLPDRVVDEKILPLLNKKDDSKCQE